MVLKRATRYSQFMNQLSFFIFLLFAPIFTIGLLSLSLLLAENKPDTQKLSPYECGMNPLGTAREKFSIQFFLIAILFIIFDLEIIFLFPFSTALYHISFYGFWIVMVFLAILTIGFIYEFSKGALKFVSERTLPSTNINSPSYALPHDDPLDRRSCIGGLGGKTTDLVGRGRCHSPSRAPRVR
jgi:NADH-quinone oxidoreductase subunit A